MRPREDQGRARQRRREVAARHGPGAQEQLGATGEEEEQGEDLCPSGQTSFEHGHVGREHDHANGETAHEAGERDQADPAHRHGEGEIGRTGHGRYLTLKGKLPSVRCPSRATALQNTWYGPGGRGGRLTSSKVPSAGSTRASPLSTCCLAPFSTRTVLNTGSTSPSNQMRTFAGDASTS